MLGQSSTVRPVRHCHSFVAEMNFERLCIMICWILNFILPNFSENFKKSDSSVIVSNSKIKNLSYKCEILFLFKVTTTPQTWNEVQETKNNFNVAHCGLVEKFQKKRMKRYATHSKCDHF